MLQRDNGSSFPSRAAAAAAAAVCLSVQLLRQLTAAFSLALVHTYVDISILALQQSGFILSRESFFSTLHITRERERENVCVLVVISIERRARAEAESAGRTDANGAVEREREPRGQCYDHA